MPIRPRRTREQKRDAWEDRYHKNFEKLAKNLPDTLYSIVSPKGREIVQKATLQTNKQMGYTFRSVTPGSKKK
jgi:hypothetical protein